MGAAKIRRRALYLGVIAAVPGSAPELVARSAPVNTAISWSDSGLPDSPSVADEAENAKIDKGLPTPMRQFGAFDFAPYRIAPDVVAFGLRGAWEEDTSGGGNYQTGLCLFVVNGDRLKRVLAVPMSSYSDGAGDWHDDGTRDHTIVDEANVLVITKRMTDGHFDLVPGFADV